MPDHTQVYKNQVELYERMISSQKSLLEVIEEITPVKGLDVLDMGAGSGRLTTILSPHVKSILATDSSMEMLQLNETRLKSKGLNNYRIQVADCLLYTSPSPRD